MSNSITPHSKAPIKILRLLNRMNLGGPARIVANLAQGLAPEYQTLVVTGIKEPDEGDASYLFEGLTPSPVFIANMKRSIHPLMDWKAYHELKHIANAFQPDIIHTHAAKAGILGRCLAMQSGIPVVHTFHGHVFHSYFSPLKTRFFIETERFLAKQSSAIIAISPSQKKELVDTYRIAPAHKVQVIPDGYDFEPFINPNPLAIAQFKEKYKLNADTLAIGIIGRLTGIKNHAFFLEIIHALKEKIKSQHIATKPPQFKVFIIGDGEERQKLMQLTSHFSLSDQVVFTSWVSPVVQALHSMDIVVLTSKNEGTPATILEAQAAGIPVVSTAVGGVCDCLLPNQSGFLIPPDNTELFCQKLITLMQSPELRTAFGKAGQQYVTQHFSKENLLTQTAKLYQSLINNNYK